MCIRDSNTTGLLGAFSNTETVVAWNGLLSMTLPVAVITSISPLDKPKASGKRMIKLSPSSFTVAVKSVPLINIFAVGVLKDMFCLLSLFTLPEINLVVPRAKVRAILDFAGFGS